MNYYKSIQNGFNTAHPDEKLSHKMYNNSGVLPRIKNYCGNTHIFYHRKLIHHGQYGGTCWHGCTHMLNYGTVASKVLSTGAKVGASTGASFMSNKRIAVPECPRWVEGKLIEKVIWSNNVVMMKDIGDMR